MKILLMLINGDLKKCQIICLKYAFTYQLYLLGYYVCFIIGVLSLS